MADYTSTHTGAVIDSAITKAATLPSITSGDANKALKVNDGETAVELVDEYSNSAIDSLLASKVGDTGDETIAGIKTFSSSPIVPTPTTDMQASTKEYVDDAIPAGVIVMWSGSIATIPTGWSLCDGSGSTPNLTDRFVIHADSDSGGTNDVGDTGGSNTISEAQLPSHTHGDGTLSAASNGNHQHTYTHYSQTGTYNMENGPHYRLPGATSGNTGSGGAHTHTISGNTGSTGSGSDYKPRYYALAYIMKD